MGGVVKSDALVNVSLWVWKKFVILWGFHVSFKEELMALFTAIEVSHSHNESASSSKLVNKESRELKRLSCSINYDTKGGSVSHGRGKEGLLLVIYEAQVVIMECERAEWGRQSFETQKLAKTMEGRHYLFVGN